MTQSIKIESKGNIGYIYLNRLSKKNALSVEMFENIASGIDSLNLNEHLRYIVIMGYNSDPPIFSSGIDLNGIAQNLSEMPKNELPEFFEHIQNSVSRIENSSKPVIAVIEGICWGAAYEIALACDFRIASDDSSIGLLETRFGMIPDLGGTTRLVKMVGRNTTKKVIMTADTFDGKEAHDLGLVDYLSSDVENELSKLIEKLEMNSYTAIKKAKKLIHEIEELNIQAGLDCERKHQLELYATGEISNRISQFLKQK